EADRLFAESPEKYSELIEKVTGIEAEVNYLFHGPLGLQTRDLTWKPEYRKALATSIETLKLLKKTNRGLDVDKFVDDQYIRAAFKQAGLDYEKQLGNYAALPLKANDALTGKPITDFKRLAQIWVRGEDKVRHYASPEAALQALASLEAEGKDIRAIYAQAADSGIKLLANQAWFVRNDKGELSAFLLKDQAEQYAQQNGGTALDFVSANQKLVASR
ncbi:MAG: nitrate ABC transporter substrate-binding protein, partial [Pseudomonas sp.]